MPLDDDDADDYILEAENASLDNLLDYLKQKFPNTQLTGVIKSKIVSRGGKSVVEHRIGSYIIEGVEDVYDAFDNYEHSNVMEPLIVQAFSVKHAMQRGGKILQSIINEQRQDFMHSGWFSAHINEVRDSDGKVLYTNHVEHM